MEKQIIRFSNRFNEAFTPADAADIINSGLDYNEKEEDITSFHENMTREELAAQYAYNCMSDEDLSDDDRKLEFEAHLECITEAGASFDQSKALDIAMKIYHIRQEDV